MKFMWPTWPMVGFSAASPVSTRLPPWRPATQWSPSRAWLSAKIRSTLTCRAMLASPVIRPAAHCTSGRRGIRAHHAAGSHRRTPRALRRHRSGSRGSRESALPKTSGRAPRGAAGAVRSRAPARAGRTPARRACRPERRRGSGDFKRTNAPCASASPRMRPWGIAMPWPSPVEPSFSRACRLSTTTFFARPLIGFEQGADRFEQACFRSRVEVEQDVPGRKQRRDLAHFLSHSRA